MHKIKYFIYKSQKIVSFFCFFYCFEWNYIINFNFWNVERCVFLILKEGGEGVLLCVEII